MSDSKKKSKLGYLFRPKGIYKSSSTTAGSSIRWIREGLRQSGAGCNEPDCEGLVEIIDDQYDRKSLICNTCGKSEDVEAKVRELSGRVHLVRSEERKLVICGFAVIAIVVIITLFNENLMTLLGGLLLSLVVFLRAFAQRYRAWQYLTGRVYESRPPIKDWLRAEFSNFDK